MFKVYFKLFETESVAFNPFNYKSGDGDQCCHHNPKSTHMDIDNIFGSKVQKDEFYKQIKTFNLGDEES